MRRWGSSFYAALFAVVAAPALAQSQSVDEYVAAELERQKIPGLSIAVVREGEIVKAQGYGYANVEHEAAATAQTVYQSGSVGKQFTATLVMMLVEEGRLSLDDRLSEHFDAAPEAWRDVTVRHLLTHTAGISNGIYRNIDMRRDYSDDELVALIAAEPLDFVPGEGWNYSNAGYVLLGLLVGRVTGEFYGDLLREKVFEPTGMTTAHVIDEAAIVPHRAAGYRLVDGELRNQEWVSPALNRLADGALYVTVLDLAAWDTALYTDELLTPASRDRMWTPVRLNDGRTEPYGFGWEIGEVRGHRVLQHGGRWQGFSAHIARYVDDELTVIVLANLAGANVSRIASGVVGLYEPDLAPAKRTPITLAREALAPFAGTYEFAPDATLTIYVLNDALMAQPAGDVALPLVPFSATEFFAEGTEVEFAFVRNSDGTVTGLTLRSGGNANEARRVGVASAN